MANVLCHPDDIRSFPMSSGWHNVSWFLCHPDEIAPSRISSGWFMTNAGCHPDDLWCCLMPSGWDSENLIPKSSGWLSYSQYLIRMTYRRCIMSSGWLTWRWYLIRMSYGKFIMSSGWHTLPFMSSGWLTRGWFLIRMSCGNVIMSSRWDTLPFLSHPDEIANFDFPQHAVALQRFRKYVSILKINNLEFSGRAQHATMDQNWTSMEPILPAPSRWRPSCGSLLSAHGIGADTRFAPSQCETALLCNDVSHWLCTTPESSLAW